MKLTDIIRHRSVDIDAPLRSSGLTIEPNIPICQTDLPLDWYQDEFRPYAEEYLALPDRTAQTVVPWMDRYVVPALDHFGDSIMLLAHFYMGGEIVSVVEHYGGAIADSYQLALQAVRHPEKSIFVESAVHFMAETITLLAHPHQQVYITNPKSGCTMETLAKEAMVAPVFDQLIDRYGDDLVVICYMNTSGRVKAMAGITGGAVCTSANAPVILRWAKEQNKKVFFIPDRHLGENTAATVGISPHDQFVWPPGWEGARTSIDQLSYQDKLRLDSSQLILWGSYCSVHTVFTVAHIHFWRSQGYEVHVHPECTREVVSLADGHGSTNYLWRVVQDAKPGAKIAIATEGHFVRNAAKLGRKLGVDVRNLADVPGPAGSVGCGCATMSRNDPPHLVGMLDLLRQGRPPAKNLVLAGDMVDESSGARERLDLQSRTEIATYARRALEKMIDLTEASRG